LLFRYYDWYGNIADGSEIIGNYVQGYKKNSPLTHGTTHGILANCGKNMEIKFNYVGFCAPGIVVKTGIEDTYISGGIAYNLCEDNQEHIWIRGVNGVNVFTGSRCQCTCFILIKIII